MPHFIGAPVPREFNQTAFHELFEFNIGPPPGDDYDARAVLPAFVTLEVNDSHIAEELARGFGAGRDGETIELPLLEIEGDRVTRFRLPVTVHFAHRNRGPQYIQIGLEDLDAHFDIHHHQRPDRFLKLSRKPDSDRDCIDETEDGDALVSD